jgi:hypothetical protein
MASPHYVDIVDSSIYNGLWTIYYKHHREKAAPTKYA